VYERSTVPWDVDGAHALLLAGEIGEATAILAREARRCRTLEYPFYLTHANLWLGEALETAGAASGACAAYRVVLRRWGHATPESQSAQEARRHSAALHCAEE
jgi:hypothetical protein